MKYSIPILFLLLSVASSFNPKVPFQSFHLDRTFTAENEPKPSDIPLSDGDLSPYFHRHTCPDLDSIIHRKVNQWVNKDYTLAASLIRLHFHDCAVRGCDASILLDHEGSERRSSASKSLRGFELIDDIKAEVEKRCPKKVSCADILTAATMEATVKIGGPFWEVPYGRKDGVVSIAKEAEKVPMGREHVTSLIQFFQSLGLNVVDLVVLSGAHTIGRSTCGAVQHRLYNYNATGKPDPSIEPEYLNYLQRKCRWASEYVNLDANTPKRFDTQYYKNLPKKMGLLSTDQMLHSDHRTSPIATSLANQDSIHYDQLFAASMVRLGNVLYPASQDNGEIRTNCKFINKPSTKY